MAEDAADERVELTVGDDDLAGCRVVVADFAGVTDFLVADLVRVG